jgi:predicted nicotinamide N-methyase
MSAELEDQLRRQFVVREEHFAHRDLSLRLLLPQSAEDLLDEEAFEKDERLPYWADLWPAARALARWLLDHPPSSDRRCIELGCGIALPALAMKSHGLDVLASDFNEDGLLFARCNAQRNGLGDLSMRLLDWRSPPADLGRFDLAIAADVLYEQRNANALADLLPRLLVPGGSFVLADPGRRWAEYFAQRLQNLKWEEREIALLEEAQRGEGVTSRVRITEWRAP